MWYVLDEGNLHIVSGEQVYCRKSAPYRNGPVPKITVQLSFTYEYDARREDDWRSLDYKMGEDWHPACIRDRILAEKEFTFREEPVKKLDIKDSLNTSVIAQGQIFKS